MQRVNTHFQIHRRPCTKVTSSRPLSRAQANRQTSESTMHTMLVLKVGPRIQRLGRLRQFLAKRSAICTWRPSLPPTSINAILTAWGQTTVRPAFCCSLHSCCKCAIHDAKTEWYGVYGAAACLFHTMRIGFTGCSGFFTVLGARMGADGQRKSWLPRQGAQRTFADSILPGPLAALMERVSVGRL